ncbi:MAG: hypothetical protein PVF27_06305, partial [Gemmatimonadales bacterium]
RDYFFTVSFQVWGMFVGLGLVGLYRLLRERLAELGEAGRRFIRLSPGVLLLAVGPLALNFSAASRAHGPDATLARDFAYDLLQSAEPYGIVFTNGDNDTFPIWYLQEVEGVRQDVSLVNLSLGNTDWYIRQLRDNPVRPFDPEQAPWFADRAPSEPPGPLHSLTDVQIEQVMNDLFQSRYRLPSDQSLRAGLVQDTFPRGTRFITSDLLIARLISENWRTRPIYFSLTAGQNAWRFYREDVTQEGLVLALHTREPPDSSKLTPTPGLFDVPVNIERSEFLVWDVYRYAGLLEADTLDLRRTERNIAFNLSFPLFALAQAHESLGDTAARDRNLRRALQLRPLPEIAQLMELGQPVFGLPFEPGDTVGQ